MNKKESPGSGQRAESPAPPVKTLAPAQRETPAPMKTPVKSETSCFSLCRGNGWALPQTLPCPLTGRALPIRTDFRVILKLFRLEEDPVLLPHHKAAAGCALFYACPGDDLPKNAYELCWQWIAARSRGGSGSPGSSQSPPSLHFEQDADAIFASFLQAYGINLLTVPYLHWYAFGLLLQNLGEDAPVVARMRLRNLDTSGLSGKTKRQAEAAKAAVGLPSQRRKGANGPETRLKQALQQGGDVSAILRQGK